MPWFLTDKGWRALCEASLLPEPAQPRVLTTEILRRHAGFPAYVAALDDRWGSLGALSQVHGIGEHPSPVDRAEMIEGAACALHEAGPVDWRGFWADVEGILRDDLSPLEGRKTLLCLDGQLHAGGVPGSAIYFRPRQ